MSAADPATVRAACPACGSPDTAPAFRSGPSFRRCRACRSLFEAAPPDPARLRELYSGREYFVKDAGKEAGGQELWGYPGDYLADRANVEAKFERVVGHLERYVEPGRLLDVGAGPGFLLTVAERRGWQPHGLDLNEWAAAYAREQLGLEVRVGELRDAGFGRAELDAVTMMDLIEHVPDPEALVAEAAWITRPGGALAILTPDAGSPVSRALGPRWPEVRRPGEHAVLFSVAGLTELLARHGFAAGSWHSIGKIASPATLAADVGPIAPGPMSRLRGALERRSIGQRAFDFDPRTKFCLYARRLPGSGRASRHRVPRVPKRPERLASVERAILEELESLAAARHLCDWMFDQFAAEVRGAVVEVGAGIGTFSARMLDRGAERMLLLEPDPDCATALERRFAGDRRVRTVREGLPDSPALAEAAGSFDLAVCQNVLEHIADDEAALGAIAGALRPGGHLALIVPAGPRLYGALDDAYGHWRRYEREELSAIVAGAGLRVEAVRPLNALGIPGWWSKNLRPGARIGPTSLAAYEALVRLWRPLEERLRPPAGLSLFCLASKP